MGKFILNENSGGYYTDGSVRADQIIRKAENILKGKLGRVSSEIFTDPSTVRTFLKIRLGQKEREIFACLFLDNRHRMIAFEELFFGTIDGATVHPREVVKRALKHNSAAIILAHNHPSGVAEPSQADQQITTRLKEACALLDIRILDHFVVGEGQPVSFAERGLI